MSEDAWLHALRTNPSPVFTERLRACLPHEREPATDTRRNWPRRMLRSASAVTPVAVVTSVRAVRASATQFFSLFRLVHFARIASTGARRNISRLAR